MNNFMKKMISILMIVVMFAGCASSTKPEETKPDEHSESAVNSTLENVPVSTPTPEDEWLGVGGCYKLEYPKMSWDILHMDVDGDDIYHSDFNFDDGSMRREIFKNGESIYVGHLSSTFAVKDSEVWICSFDIINNTHKEYVSKLGTTEDNSESIDISPYLKDSWTVSMCIDNNDRFYVQTPNSVIVLNSDGSHLSTIDCENLEGMVTGGDNKVYILTGDGTTVMSLDFQSENAVKYMEFPEYRIFHGGLGYQFILGDENGIYGVTESQEIVPIVIWEECGIPLGDLISVHPSTNDSYVLQDTETAYILRPALPEEIKPKTKLTLATVTSPRTRIWVENFNKYNDDYMIQIEDYSNGSHLSIEDAVISLNNDLKDGNYPDLFDFSYMPESYYVEKGLVADLYPFIDGDSDINRDDFILLDKMTLNDKLYYISSYYFIDAKLGPYSMFGDSKGWSLDECLELQEQNNGAIFSTMSRDGFVNSLSSFYLADAIDWETNTCNFENDDFIKILEVSKQIREKKDSQVKSFYIGSVWAIAEQEKLEEEKLSFIGCPTLQGTEGNIIVPDCLAGICSKGNTQGSWEFIKYMMTDTLIEEKTYGLPILKAEFERRLEKEMIPREIEANAPFSMYENNSVVMTQEDVDRFIEFLDSSVYLGNAPHGVLGIITDESAKYFSGEKTAEETAQIIQKKVNLILSKQF